MGGNQSSASSSSRGAGYASGGSGSIGVGETGRRRRNLHARFGSNPLIQVLLEEEVASRATIQSEYSLESNRIANRHPLSTQSIATYTTEKHLLFIRHGKVYDATSWFETHPGGKFVMLKYAGQDISDIFDRFHSRKTKNELLKEVLVGDVWHNGSGGFTPHRNTTPVKGSNNAGPAGPSRRLGSPVHGSSATPKGAFPPASGGGSSAYPNFMVSSPTGSDHGDYEGRIVRIKPLTDDGSVVRIYIAFPERLLCELGGSIVVKYRGQPRNYSPCFIEETNFSLVVKRYEKGVVSNYLFSKKIGDCLEFDGPYSPKVLVPDRPFKTLLLIGQGTGVVPVLEVARTVLAETIFFVSCYSKISDVLFSKELSLLPDSVRLIYFIPSADPVKDADKVPGLLFNSRLTPELLMEAMTVAGGCPPASASTQQYYGGGGASPTPQIAGSSALSSSARMTSANNSLGGALSSGMDISSSSAANTPANTPSNSSKQPTPSPSRGNSALRNNSSSAANSNTTNVIAAACSCKSTGVRTSTGGGGSDDAQCPQHQSSSVAAQHSPSKRPPSLIEATFICGSFTFFDDVQTSLCEGLGISKKSIVQL